MVDDPEELKNLFTASKSRVLPSKKNFALLQKLVLLQKKLGEMMKTIIQKSEIKVEN